MTLGAPVNATILDGAGVGTILDNGTGAGGTDNDTAELQRVECGRDGRHRRICGLHRGSLEPLDDGCDRGPRAGQRDGGRRRRGLRHRGAGNLQVSTDGGTTWNDAATATIAAGQLSVLVRTPITNDLLDEAPEAFTLTATRISGVDEANHDRDGHGDHHRQRCDAVADHRRRDGQRSGRDRDLHGHVERDQWPAGDGQLRDQRRLGRGWDRLHRRHGSLTFAPGESTQPGHRADRQRRDL